MANDRQGVAPDTNMPLAVVIGIEPDILAEDIEAVEMMNSFDFNEKPATLGVRSFGLIWCKASLLAFVRGNHLRSNWRKCENGWLLHERES